MRSLPVEVYSVASVREVDRVAINDKGIPGYTLMTRAAEAAVREARERFPNASRWQILCGSGNNGGDGYVVARLAAADGIDVSLTSLSDTGTLTGDAATACAEFLAAGGRVLPWSGAVDKQAGLIVDALLGTGLQRDVGGNYAAAVQAINAADASVLALDIPTGLHGDTGAVLGCAVRAQLTVTFVGLKQGLFLGDAPEYCGDIRFSGLAIDASCFAGLPVAMRRIEHARVAALLPPRARTAHKGNFGHVLVVGGGPGMPGAVRLCGEGALRAGAGRVSVATDLAHANLIVKDRPELMARGAAGGDDLKKALHDIDVVAFGPGLGRSQWARDMFSVLQQSEIPAVWDADALNLLAEKPHSRDSRIITPHPGEAATLLGTTTQVIQADRCDALSELQARYGGIVVLKGAGSLISGEGGTPWLNTSGNPGMAAPGMGDVLTGIIAALLAQGLSFEEAAMAGVELHARAGDLAAGKGERGLMASDLLAELRRAVNP